MSTHVTSIITEMKSQIATVLGATWQELQFVQELNRNNTRTAKNAYGVRPLDASSAEGAALRTITLDHFFEIILTDALIRRKADTDVEASTGTLYDKADEIFKVLVNSKVNLPSIVLSVSEPSLSAPEIIEDANLIAVRMRVKVKYRSTL